jgi:hypothetical protein
LLDEVVVHVTEHEVIAGGLGRRELLPCMKTVFFRVVGASTRGDVAMARCAVPHR